MIMYLGGAIDYANEKMDWKQSLKEYIHFTNPKVTFYNPKEAFTAGQCTAEAATYIYNINMAALKSADIMVARLSKESSSIGTPIEVALAVENKLKVVIYTNMESSFYIKYFESLGATVVTQADKLQTTVNNIVTQMMHKNHPFTSEAQNLFGE